MQNLLLIFIHLFAASLALGALLFGVFLFLPLLHENKSQKALPEDSMEIKLVNRLSATVLGCLFTLIITGVYYLLINYTDQVNLKPGYYNIFGMKMLFVLTALGISLYQTFSLRPKISDLDLRPENKSLVPKILRSMANINQINIWIIGFAAFFGVFLNRF